MLARRHVRVLGALDPLGRCCAHPLVVPPQPAPADAAEVVLTFLENVGRRSEAELYLRLFRKLPKESFALIAPGAPVVRQTLGSLVEQLRFLADLGLFAPVVLGLFDPEVAATGSERLLKRIPTVGLDPKLHAMAEPDLADRLREDLRAERVPIVRFLPGASSGFAERTTELGSLASLLDTRKVVLLRRRGGLTSRSERSPGDPPRPEGRISVINLRTDREGLLKVQKLGKRDLELLEIAERLIGAVVSGSLLVSVTSPLNLLQELFTVRGAGTLIKQGTAIERYFSYADTDLHRLSQLLEQSFGRSLNPSFFERAPLRIYVESAFRGAAILHAEQPAPYLTKFAVEPEAQGEGIGNDLWQAMLRDHPRLFWRGRPDNPINAWYHSVCDGMVRLPLWTVFFRGIGPDEIARVVDRANTLPSDFLPP